MNLHASFSLNDFHHTISSPRTQGPIGRQRLEPAARKSPKHVSFLLCFISKERHIRPAGWVHLKFGYFRGKARGIKANYEEVKQIQEELDALAMGGPEMDHELSMVKNSRMPTAIVTSFSRCLWVREVKAPRQTCRALRLISPLLFMLAISGFAVRWAQSRILTTK